MKEITIAPDDLKELQEVNESISPNTPLDESMLKVLGFMKQRKLTTRRLLRIKLGLKDTTARYILERLRLAGLISKQYTMLKGEDNTPHRTALYFVVEEKNGRKRNSK